MTISGRAVRTIEKNKVGFHYANVPYDEHRQVEKALESAHVLDTRYQWDITFPGPQTYPEVKAIFDRTIEEAEIADVVNYCKTLVDRLNSYSISARGVCYCRKSEIDLKTSNHLEAHEKGTFFTLDMDVTTGDATFNVVKSSRQWDETAESLADSIREHASWYSRTERGFEPAMVAFGSRALYAVLRPLVWQLSVDRIKRRISNLRPDQRVAGAPFTLVDDGTYPGGPRTSLCDGEGIPSARHNLVKNGIVQMFMYDHFHALLDKKESTGNAVRSSMMAPPKIRARTLVVEEGRYSLEKFTGVVVEEVVNDKGANLVSGEYVFNIKRAFYFKKGEVTGMVHPFVLKGNIFDFLQSVQGVGILKENPFPQYRELITPYVFIQISA